MKTKIFYLILTSMFLLVSCSSSFKITKTIDAENPNIIIYRSSQIHIKGISMTDTYNAYLRYFAFVNKGKLTYAFDIFYRGRQWGLFNKVRLNIAGVKSEYEIKTPPIRKADAIIGLTEELVVNIPNDKIEELIDNRKCKMTVIGQNLKIKVNFKQEWFDRLIKFYAVVNKK